MSCIITVNPCSFQLTEFFTLLINTRYRVKLGRKPYLGAALGDLHQAICYSLVPVASPVWSVRDHNTYSCSGRLVVSQLIPSVTCSSRNEAIINLTIKTQAKQQTETTNTTGQERCPISRKISSGIIILFNYTLFKRP